MRIDVWSDIVCPFCHLGRRHLELALEQFEHADEVGVVWHSFQLDPNAPAVDRRPMVEVVAAKYGTPPEVMTDQMRRMASDAAAVGLDFAWERLVGGNTYDAHRLLHHARSVGREQEVTDRVMRAWYTEGAAIGDHETLVRLGADAGLALDDVRALLAGDDFGIDVRTDLALAAQIGITAVPMFVLDQRYGVSGAQPAEVLLGAIRQVWERQGTEPEEAAAEGGCGGGCCGGVCGSEVEAETADAATTEAGMAANQAQADRAEVVRR
ncbi:MAG: DsbA family oxidoreductase [Dermatophilaceae bacterium]